MFDLLLFKEINYYDTFSKVLPLLVDYSSFYSYLYVSNSYEEDLFKFKFYFDCNGIVSSVLFYVLFLDFKLKEYYKI